MMVLYAQLVVSCSPPEIDRQAEFANQFSIGVWGPVEIQVPDTWEDVESTIEVTIEPDVDFSQKWQDSQLFLWFTKPLKVGETYQVNFSRSNDGSGQNVSKQTWEFTPRPVELVYLVPFGDGGEIWRVDPVSGDQTRLSSTENSVLTFHPAPDGNHIVFAAGNAENGSDIWVVNRDGSETTLVVNCGETRCTSPVYSPAGALLAYIEGGVKPGTSADRKARIILWDTHLNQQVDVYEIDSSPVLKELAWSSSGEYLGFFDATAMKIMVLAVETGEVIEVACESSEMGYWSPLEDTMYLACLKINSGDTCKVIYEYDFPAGEMEISPVYEILQRKDYSPPAQSYDGRWIVLGERCVEERPTKQLWLIDLFTFRAEKITENVRYHYSNYRWDPGSENLVVQQYEMGSSSSKPAILTWNKETRSLNLLVENAHSAVWLP